MMHSTERNGIVSVPTSTKVSQAVKRFEQVLNDSGLVLFALIDHSEAALHNGLNMPPTQLLIFGNPVAGTPLMLAAPLSAIDLPMKALIWEDAAGQVWISYNTMAYLQQRHGLSEALAQHLAGIASLCEKAADPTILLTHWGR